jgi:preprotein translocase SecF subunit
MEKTIKFMEYRFISYAITVALFALFIAGTVMRGGFNWGIDFVGGVKVIAGFNSPVAVSSIRDAMRTAGINAEVQQFGEATQNQFVISTRLTAADRNAPGTSVSGQGSAQRVQSALTQNFPGVTISSTEEVGPAIGDYLKKSAVYLILWCVVIMALYLAFRFEYRFSITAMIALLHDVVLSFLFLGMMGVEINIPIVAGILTIFGYSINDTIIVYDRIRENLDVMAKQSIKDIVNRSISQTLNRTILTVFTTLLAVFCLYMIGEDVINDFALLLLFGFALGVFSTFGVASPLIYEWNRIRPKQA